VLIGVGQVTERPTPGATYASRKTPLDLMVEALELAANDSGAGRRALETIDEVVAVSSFTWHTPDPALLVAQHLGLSGVTTRLTSVGGNTPQKLIHESALRMLAGELTCVAVVGSEAMYSRLLARREGLDVDWMVQDNRVFSPVVASNDAAPLTAAEYEQGLNLPTNIYPLFENARRARLGWSLNEHRERLGQLWSNFAKVAATNPYAWITHAPRADEIANVSEHNRMVSYPYTKMLMANVPVDMGAAYILTTFEHATSLGVARDAMVFPACGVDANDHWLISDRPVLDASPAMSVIWNAMQQLDVRLDDVASIDLYSCFPTVVQTACDVLGIDAFDSSFIPSLTGGLTFGGGPGNNYVTHSICSMVETLRANPDGQGLVSALGWFCTKHSWGTYATSPPAKGFRHDKPQETVDRLPRCVSEQRDGAVTVESYTVTHARDGSPERLIVAARTNDDVRTWCHSTDERTMVDAESNDLIGRTGSIASDVISF
jgi:acetyl-CoA C-acetyltransferase